MFQGNFIKASSVLCALLPVLLSCQTRRYTAATSSSSSSEDLVVVNCMTPQGNGGNWAATLGWIAADFEVQADRLRFLSEKTGRKAYVYPKCFSGGSSGSGATNVVMQLFENFAVLGESEDREGDSLRKAGFFTANEMQSYSRAMRFLALSVDMSASETYYFFKNLAHEQAVAMTESIPYIKTALPIAREWLEKVAIFVNPFDSVDTARVDHKADAMWWGAAVASAEGAVIDFGKLVYAAKKLTRKEIEADIATAFNAGSYKGISFFDRGLETLVELINLKSAAESDLSVKDALIKFASDMGIKTVTDFPKFSSLEEMKCQSADKCNRIVAASRIAKALKGKDAAAKLGFTDDQTLNYAQFYLLEAMQAYYAGSVVDRLGNEGLSENFKTARPRQESFKVYDLKTRFNSEFEQARDGAAETKFSSYLTQTLWDKMQEGYFTITAAAIHKGPQNAKQRTLKFYSQPPGFDYSQPNGDEPIRFVIFADESTSEAIRESELFKAHTRDCPEARRKNEDLTACRFVIAQVKNSVYSMLPSVREPGLMNELYVPAYVFSKVGSEHMGVHEIFDPEVAPLGLQNMISPDGAQTYFAVAGGWPDRRIGAWMLMYYMDTLLNSDGKFSVRTKFQKAKPNANPLLIGVVSMFGKPDRASKIENLAEKGTDDLVLAGKFDVSAVANVFSGKKPSQKQFESKAPEAINFQNQSRKNKDRYLRMTGEFYQFIAGSSSRLDRKGVPVLLQETSNNWDISEFPQPAFIPNGLDQGASRYLVELSHNALREGIISLYKTESSKADGQKTGLNTAQLCPLSRFERKFKSPLKVGPVNLLPAEPDGETFVSRLMCFRRLASSQSAENLKTMGLPNFSEELQALAANSKVTFSALDPRISLGRKDANMILRDSSGNVLVINADDGDPQVPRPNAEQRQKLRMDK